MLLLLMFQSKNSEYTSKTKKNNSQNLEFRISLFFIKHIKSTVENTFKNKEYIISIYSKLSENYTSFTPIEFLNLETPWLRTLDNLSEYLSCLVLNHNQWAPCYKSICVLLINPNICIKPQFNHHSALLSTKVYSFKRLKKKLWSQLIHADTTHQLLDSVLVVLIIAYASLTVTMKILQYLFISHYLARLIGILLNSGQLRVRTEFQNNDKTFISRSDFSRQSLLSAACVSLTVWTIHVLHMPDKGDIKR